MQITGVITKVLPKVQGTSAASGKEWVSQEYVVTTQEQYPKSVCFKVFGADRIEQFHIQINEVVTISFDIKTHEYNGRVFNDIQAWGVDRQTAQQTAQEPLQQVVYQNQMGTPTIYATQYAPQPPFPGAQQPPTGQPADNQPSLPF